MRLIDRYIVTEMAGPFFFGITTFTLLFLSADVLMRAARMIVDQGHSASVAGFFVLCNLPAVLAYAFPMSALLACLLAFGRLSADSEVVAMKAGGISFYRMATPGLAMTVMLAGIAMYLTDYVVPEANYQARNIFLRQVTREEGRIENLKFQDVAPDGTARIIMARRFDIDRGLLTPLTVNFYRKDTNTLVRQMNATEAIYSERGWEMFKVHTQELDDHLYTTMTSYAEKMALPLAQTPQELASRPRGRDEMNRQQLLMKASKEREIQGGADSRKVYSYLVEYYSRIALPFSCFVFGLFGIPLGLQPQRTSKSIGLGLSIIFIFIYYLLMTLSRSLGESGVLMPLVASWLPNIVFGGVGIALLVRAGRI